MRFVKRKVMENKIPENEIPNNKILNSEIPDNKTWENKSQKHKISTRDITCTGIMAAAVYAASAFLQIPIPTVIGSTRLHLGNVMCLLSGMLLGPVSGGLAAGIGSMLFDLTNPAYISSAPFTFAFKYAMAWICGKIVSSFAFAPGKRYILGAVSGASSYVALYLAKNFMEYRFVLEMPLEAVLAMTAQKAGVSGLNAAVAVVMAVPLGVVLRPIVRKLMRYGFN